MKLSVVIVAIAIGGIAASLIVVFGYLTAIKVPTDGLAAFAAAIIIPMLTMLINYVKTISIAKDVTELKENINGNGGDATSPPSPEGKHSAD